MSGLSPNTVYRVTVKAKNIRSPHFNLDENTPKYAEKYCTHVEFRTLPKGVPDPPVDVQVEIGPQDGTILVTWLPVTINSHSGKSNGVPVTGYAVYADGRKVTEVDSPTGTSLAGTVMEQPIFVIFDHSRLKLPQFTHRTSQRSKLFDIFAFIFQKVARLHGTARLKFKVDENVSIRLISLRKCLL